MNGGSVVVVVVVVVVRQDGGGGAVHKIQVYVEPRKKEREN